jgi:hypothetical protein
VLTNNEVCCIKDKKVYVVYCGQSLGYLIYEKIEIQHLKRVSPLNVSDSSFKDINNLYLVHTSCVIKLF